uniref:Movement protein n=1 Tax=Mesocestoides corti TaxID=53468 RepID=A0A0R3UDU3_MESCO
LEASGSASGELIEGGGDSTVGGSASVLEQQPGRR